MKVQVRLNNGTGRDAWVNINSNGEFVFGKLYKTEAWAKDLTVVQLSDLVELSWSCFIIVKIINS